MRVAKSPSDQWDTGMPASAGLGVASTMPLWRSAGGKSDRSAATGQMVEANQALAQETPPPACHGVGMAAKFGSDLVIGGPVGLGTAEDDACPKGQSLRAGAGSDQLLEQRRLTQKQAETWRFT